MRYVTLYTVESEGNPPICVRTLNEAITVAEYLRHVGELAVRICSEVVAIA